MADEEIPPPNKKPEPPKPCGVIAIITNATGHVIAHAADFDQSGYGGFKLWEAQRLRVRQAVLRAVVRAYSSPAFYEALSAYHMEGCAEDLLSAKGGHRLTVKSVGYPLAVAAEIERR